jgi:hypothetical protein
MTTYIQPVVDAAKSVPGMAGAAVARATNALSSAKPCPALSEPLLLGDLSLRNRNFMASLTRNRSVPTTVPNEANVVCIHLLVTREIDADRPAAVLHAARAGWRRAHPLGGCTRQPAGHGVAECTGHLVRRAGAGLEEGHCRCARRGRPHLLSAVARRARRAPGHAGAEGEREGVHELPKFKIRRTNGCPQPVPGPSAIAANGGKFRELPGQPGYVTVRSRDHITDAGP